MKNIFYIVQIFFAIFNLSTSTHAKSMDNGFKIKTLFQMEITKTINPASLSHLKEVIKKINETPESGLLIKINTPGGLVSVTKNMITDIGEAKVPFIAFVGPEGASATSAGAILSAASHYLVMAQGTNIGAATPITMQKEMPKDSRAKAINDLVALVTSLREARGKEAKFFEKMITKAESFSAQKALDLKIADDLISTVNELKKALHQKTIILNDKPVQLDTSELTIQNVEMDIGQKVLNFLASPELAYLMFLLGAALIYFELQAPGGFIAGSLGVICLILAAVSFQVIPLNMGGLGLILLSFALFFLEIYITSFGLLSLAGLAALVTGSLFLFRTNDAYFELSRTVIFSTITAIVTFMGIIVGIFLRNKKQMSINFNETLPETGTIIRVFESIGDQNHYQIRARGEIWKARSPHKFKLDEIVAIVQKDQDNMTYIVGPFKN